MYQVRIYTVKTPEVANEYFHVHWRRHIASLKKFNIETIAVFKEEKENGETHVIAICKYEDGADVDAVNKAYMDSEEFKSDMSGFDFNNFCGVTDFTVSIDDYISNRKF